MITVHDGSNEHTLNFQSQQLSPDDLARVVCRLKRFTVVDQEASHYLALMKIIEDMPDEAIDDGLYDSLQAVLKKEFMLFRYYGPTFSQVGSEYPGYNSKSLLRYPATQTYLSSWADTQEQFGIHPATLFASKVMSDDNQKNPLPYLSYCRDPLCQLSTLSPYQAGDYIKTLINTLNSFVDNLSPTEPIVYVGCASGLFGRDALRLNILSRLLAKKGKHPSAISIVLIDPIYSQLMSEKQSMTLSLGEQANLSLIKKSVANFFNFVFNTLNTEAKLDLFSSLNDAKQYLNDQVSGASCMCAEDFFKDEVETAGVNQVLACRDMLKKDSSKLNFHAFICQKDKHSADVLIEAIQGDHEETVILNAPQWTQGVKY